MTRGAKQFAGGLRDFARAGLAPLKPAITTANRIGGHQFDLDGQDVVFGPGDWFINLGASWDTQYAPEFLEKLRADGARFALIAYDLIPELFPEWCHQMVVREFRIWLRDVVPQADLMFVISRNTATDLTNCLQKLGKPVPPQIVLPVGNVASRDAQRQPEARGTALCADGRHHRGAEKPRRHAARLAADVADHAGSARSRTSSSPARSAGSPPISSSSSTMPTGSAAKSASSTAPRNRTSPASTSTACSRSSPPSTKAGACR